MVSVVAEEILNETVTFSVNDQASLDTYQDPIVFTDVDMSNIFDGFVYVDTIKKELFVTSFDIEFTTTNVVEIKFNHDFDIKYLYNGIDLLETVEFAREGYESDDVVDGETDTIEGGSRTELVTVDRYLDLPATLDVELPTPILRPNQGVFSGNHDIDVTLKLTLLGRSP